MVLGKLGSEAQISPLTLPLSLCAYLNRNIVGDLSSDLGLEICLHPSVSGALVEDTLDKLSVIKKLVQVRIHFRCLVHSH
jgi:hypothetical protein